MIALAAGPLAVAFVITVLELTEVVALVFALGVEPGTLRPAALGAAAGTAAVTTLAVAAGAALLAFPERYLLWASAVVLAAFGVFLFRSTLRTYRRSQGVGVAPARNPAVLRFAGGFGVGAIETTEAVVVLLALTAAGAGSSAVVGAVAGGVCLVVAAGAVRERIRRIKTAWLKLGATSMVLTFSAFWAGEAAGLRWPGADLALLPIFGVALLAVRGAVELGLRRRVPDPTAPVP